LDTASTQTNEEGGLSYLLHCILHKRTARTPGLIFAETGNLAAALSLRSRQTDSFEAPQLVAYERKVAALHAGGPVIPMRYGYFVEDEATAVRLLEEHRAEYEELLDRLKGRVEMGLRVVWGPAGESRLASEANAPAPDWVAADLTQSERTWAAGIEADLADLYAEERSEARPNGSGRVVSLHFLVPRRAVRSFRAQLHGIVSSQGRDFLMSGPGPPWNFAMAAAPKRRCAR
jgi:hypothetical protein